jgi:hypothetical protein
MDEIDSLQGNLKNARSHSPIELVLTPQLQRNKDVTQKIDKCMCKDTPG